MNEAEKSCYVATTSCSPALPPLEAAYKAANKLQEEVEKRDAIIVSLREQFSNYREQVRKNMIAQEVKFREEMNEMQKNHSERLQERDQAYATLYRFVTNHHALLQAIRMEVQILENEVNEALNGKISQSTQQSPRSRSV